MLFFFRCFSLKIVSFLFVPFSPSITEECRFLYIFTFTTAKNMSFFKFACSVAVLAIVTICLIDKTGEFSSLQPPSFTLKKTTTISLIICRGFAMLVMRWLFHQRHCNSRKCIRLCIKC